VGSLLTAAVLYQISKWVLLPLRPEIAKGSWTEYEGFSEGPGERFYLVLISAWV
jgi:hypothetical protein